MIALPTIAFPIPPAPKFDVFPVRKSMLISPAPLTDDAGDHQRENRDRQQRGGPGADLHHPIHGMAAPQIAALSQERMRRGRAHASLPPPERCWMVRTNSRATPLKTSDSTSRITARYASADWVSGVPP